MPDPRTQHKDILFSGKLMMGEPAAIGMNFRTLKNLRYTDTHIKGVAGMTNLAALGTYLKTRNAFHFKKSQPSESHVLVQAYNAGLTASQILENTTAIPGAEPFSATVFLTDSSGAGRGRFSDAPDGQMIYANGVDTCIWGGNEIKCGAFITSTAEIVNAATNPKDYTDIINNLKTDSANRLLLGVGSDVSIYPPAQNDTYVKATSRSSSAYWPYYATDPTRSLIGSGYYNAWISGNGSDVNQRFHIDLGTATVIKMIYYENAHTSGANTIRGAKNFTFWGSNTASAFAELTYGIDTNWTQLTTSQTTLDQHTPSDVADPKYITVTNTTGYRYYAFKFADNYGDIANMGVRRIELKLNVDPDNIFAVGSPRPLKGMKIYIHTANGTTSTLTGKTWNGVIWETLALTDNTDTGPSLAQTGTVTWPSTVGTSKPKYLEGYYLYWYQFALSAGAAAIYHVTLDAPFQPILDMWDGVFREVTRFYKRTTVYTDNTTNVLYDDYDKDSVSTYCDIDDLIAFSEPNYCLEIGFTEKQTGLKIDIASGYVNTVAATTAAIDYWNGFAYVSANLISDGTSEGGISFAKPGVIHWDNNSLQNETKKVVSNSPPLYYYRLRFDKGFPPTRINYVAGIAAQKEINYFKFPVFAQGRVLLCADMSGEKNKAICSGKYMPQVYNGVDSVDIYFGEEGELTCGTSLFSLFGSSLYSLILMFKDNETWIMAGQDIDQWETNTFLLSSSIGCPAPLTLKTINLHTEPTVGVNRALAIWQGTNGIYMSDGRAPIPIHGDIKEYFDPLDPRCIKVSMVGDSIGFIDPVRQEYHWLFASGTSATGLNTELVYDIARNKWFEIDRTADLQCGVTVHDTDGNGYAYGFLDTGYMERLEFGATFDGTPIVHTVQFGDIPLGGLAVETRLSAARLIVVAKTSGDVTLTHYADTSSAGTDKIMSSVKSGYRVAMPKFTDKFNGDPFHSFKLVATAGFEPLALVTTFHPVHED